MRPFPYQDINDEQLVKFKTTYRENMIKEAGICIFLFGNKTINGKNIYADGVREEFEISKKLNKYLIPIGSTGFVTKEIFNEITNERKRFWYLQPEIDVLQKSLNIDEILNSILRIINEIRAYDKYQSNKTDNA